MIHEPHEPQDCTIKLATLGASAHPVTATARAAALPLPGAPARLFVNWAENEYHGRQVSLHAQRDTKALVHIEGHIYLYIDTCHLLVIPGAVCA